MEKKENQRVTITKRILLEALLELLEKKHINEISVTELCRAAGINRATFYKHYSTPNDILLGVNRTLMQQLHAIQQGDSDVRGIIERSCLFIHENADMVRILIKSNLDETFARSSFQTLGNLMYTSKFWQREDCDETDRKLWVTFIVSGCYSLMRAWLTEDIDKTPQEIAGLIYDLCTKGWMLH